MYEMDRWTCYSSGCQHVFRGIPRERRLRSSRILVCNDGHTLRAVFLRRPRIDDGESQQNHCFFVACQILRRDVCPLFSQYGVPRAWTSLDWDVLDRLSAYGWIYDPKGKTRSVVCPPEGAAYARILAEPDGGTSA